MPPAVIGGVVAGVGAIGGALIGSKAQKSAANAAVDASAAAAEAQLQLGRESLALNRDIYNSNYDMLSPWVSRGNVAGNAFSALLGLPTAPRMTSPISGGGVGGTGSGSTANRALDGAWSANAMQALLPHLTDGTNPNRGFYTAYQNFAASNPIKYAAGGGLDPTWAAKAMQAVMPAVTSNATDNPDRAISQVWNNFTGTNPIKYAPAATTPGTGGAGTGGGNAGQTAQNAFEQFANSAGMQFQLDTAHDAINNGYAGAGALQSGAAMKEISDRSQDIALNNYFMPYMNMLSGLSGQGAQAGSAVAGVGSQFGNTAANINANMGGVIGQNAANIGNAALATGNATANMWNGLGSSFGNIGGIIAGMK